MALAWNISRQRHTKSLRTGLHGTQRGPAGVPSRMQAQAALPAPPAALLRLLPTRGSPHHTLNPTRIPFAPSQLPRLWPWRPPCSSPSCTARCGFGIAAPGGSSHALQHHQLRLLPVRNGRAGQRRASAACARAVGCLQALPWLQVLQIVLDICWSLARRIRSERLETIHGDSLPAQLSARWASHAPGMGDRRAVTVCRAPRSHPCSGWRYSWLSHTAWRPQHTPAVALASSPSPPTWP